VDTGMARTAEWGGPVEWHKVRNGVDGEMARTGEWCG